MPRHRSVPSTGHQALSSSLIGSGKTCPASPPRSARYPRETVIRDEGSPDPSPVRGTSPRLDSMNRVVAHDEEGDSDAGEKEQGRSADQERHAQEDRRPEEDGCSAKACRTEQAGGQEGHDPEEDSGPEQAGGQEGHDPEEDSGPAQAGGQEGHDPEEDSGPEQAGGQDV